MVIEHPAFPIWGQHLSPPSIWKLPQCKSLLDLQGVVLHTLDQCMWGSTAKKPTSLLAVHLPSLDLRLATAPSQRRCTGDHHHVQLGGKDIVTGDWHTAPHKQYPRQFSELLAAAITDNNLVIQKGLANYADPWEELGDEVLQCYCPLDDTAGDQGLGLWGPDFNAAHA